MELVQFHAQALGHGVVKKAFAGRVGLHPFAIDDELRDGSLSGMANDFVGGSGSLLNVNFAVRDFVAIEEALGFAAVRAPEGGIDGNIHRKFRCGGVGRGSGVRKLLRVNDAQKFFRCYSGLLQDSTQRTESQLWVEWNNTTHRTGWSRSLEDDMASALADLHESQESKEANRFGSRDPR